MRGIDQMIRKAKALLTDATCSLFSDNDDGFIDALGVDPEKYKRTAPDGTVGYDFLKALSDTAKEDWK